MKLVPTPLAGVFIVEIVPLEDERGFFARTYHRDEFAQAGLNPDITQCSVSFNTRRGTLRGMHFQAAPHEETKLVRCTRGAVYDVALDLRPGSPTFRQWFAVELTADRRNALYIPVGCAHGFQTLTDGAEVFYQITPGWQPDAGRGVRWNDPAFGITWPIPDPTTMSARDAGYPDFAP